MESKAVMNSGATVLKRSGSCGRRNRKRRQGKSKLRPVVCNHDRKIVELRQWMKKTAGFVCPLTPANFHGKMPRV